MHMNSHLNLFAFFVALDPRATTCTNGCQQSWDPVARPTLPVSTFSTFTSLRTTPTSLPR